MKEVRFVGVVLAAVCAFEAAAATRTVEWELPANWADGLEIAGVDGFGMIRADGLGSRSGLGEVGEPNLPFKAFSIDVKKGGTISDVACDVEWEKVEVKVKDEGEQRTLLPFPIVPLVKVGDPIVMPELSAAYQTVYPTNQVDVGDRQIFRGDESFTIRVTPFRWDGTTKTLYRASKLKVKVEVEEKTSLKLQTSNLKLQTSSANAESAANFIILAPHKFYDLWCAYAEFRKNSKGGQGLTFMVKDLNDLYENNYKPSEHINGYTKKPDYELCIHKWLEDMYAQKEKVKVEGEGEKEVPILKYILLGGTPAKYQFDAEEHIPSRRFAAVATNGYLSDAYYGCMDKKDKSGNATTEGEVWDYECDGVYMAELQSAGWIKCYDAVTKSVDWDPDVSVFRFPLMRAVKDGTGAGVYQTAEQIMDTFTNRIAWAESEDFPEEKRNIYANTGGHMHKSWNRGATLSEVNGEHEFFEGRLNVFDPNHPTPYMDSEIYSRHHVPDLFSVYRGWKDNSTIHTCNYNPNTYAEIYANSGEIINNLAHGWARGADPMSAPQAYSATGFYRAYIIGNSCDCGMFDYCPDGSYGITNCICVGEAPILNPNPHCGALVSYTNARFGYGDSYTWNGSDCMDHFINAGWAGTDEHGNSIGEMNGGEAHLFACKKFQQYGNPKCSEVNGVCEMEIICHGDPLIRLSPETNAVNSTEFICVRDFYFDASNGGLGGCALPFVNNSTSAGFYLNGDNSTVHLQSSPSPSSARFRATRETVLTNVSELVWEVEGGAGRKGITFVGQAGRLTLPGNTKRYFGQAFKNVSEISVSGGNVTLDFPQSGSVADCADFTRLSFVADKLSETEDFNILRTRQKGFFPAGQNLVVVSNRLDLQTANIGAPIYATNAVIKVSPNPNWSGETFTQKVELVASELRSNSDNFYLAGTLDIGGETQLAGAKPMCIKGTATLRLNDGAVLDVSATFKDGAGGDALEVVAAAGVTGKVRFLTVPEHTGGTTIGAGATLESADGLVLPTRVTIVAGGTFAPQTLPISGVGTMTLEDGATLVLPEGDFNGAYPLVNPLDSTIEFGANVNVVDADGNPIVGTYVKGTFIETAKVLTWNAGAWTTNSSEMAWRDASGDAAAFSDGRPVKFTDTANTVSLTSDVKPGAIEFANDTSAVTITGDHEIALDTLFADTDITIEGALKTSIQTAISDGMFTVGTIESPLVEVANGAKLKVAQAALSPERKIKRIKFSFVSAQSSSERTAIAELRLFDDAGFFALPVGTRIRDCEGNEIEIAGISGTAHAWTVISGDGGNESLRALVDGTLQNCNKWWASKSASPTWFEIEFPDVQDVISGYTFYAADHAPRNPKAWSVAYAEEGGDYVTLQNVTGFSDSSAYHWLKGDGTATGEQWPLMTAGGTLNVLTGGALYADGTSGMDLVFAEDSTLAVIGQEAIVKGAGAALRMPESGVVRIDTTEAAETNAWFKIVEGFNLSDAQFLKFACDNAEVALKLEGGDLWLVTQGVQPSPYTASVSGAASWDKLVWSADGTATGKDWSQMTTKSDGEATLSVADGESVLTVDTSATLATLKLVGGKDAALTVRASGEAALSLRTVDASEFLGTLTIELPLKSADIVAGANTIVANTTAMTGTLTLGANAKATLESGTSIAKLDVQSPSAWLRLNGNRGNVSLAGLAEGKYSYEKVNLTAGLENANVTMIVEAGDAVTIVGSSSNNNGANLINWDIRGGEVALQANATTTSWGRSGGEDYPGSRFIQTGGVFRCVMTNSGRKFTLGYAGTTATENPATILITGGEFIVDDGAICLNNPTVIDLDGDAVMTAEGYQSCGQKGEITVSGDARLEVGSQGFAVDTASVEFNRGTLLCTGGSVLFTESIEMWNAVDPVTIAVVSGASMQLNGIEGVSPVQVGCAENGWTGSVIVAAAASLPAHFTIDGATLELGTVRSATADTHILDAYPTNGGKITLTMNESVKTAMIRCADFVNDLTDEQIKAMFQITRNGAVLEDVQWTASVTDNVIYFSPESASGYIFPVCAYALSSYSQNWSDLTWQDSAKLVAEKKSVTKADWPKVAGGSATITHTTGAKTLVLDVGVDLTSMRVSNTYGTMNFNCTGDYTLNIRKELYLADGSMDSVKNTFVGNVTVGSLRCNSNVEFGGVVTGEVTIPASGTYTQTAGSFGSLNLGAGAVAIVSADLVRDELTIKKIQFNNATQSAITIDYKTFDLGASFVDYSAATLTITEDVTWVRLNEIVAATGLDISRFAFSDGVTVDCGTGRDLKNVPNTCRLRFQLTEAEEAGLITGISLIDAGGTAYSADNITVVDHNGEAIAQTLIAVEDGKVVFKREFDGTAYASVNANLNWWDAAWHDAHDYTIRKADWWRVKDIDLTSGKYEITVDDSVAVTGTMKLVVTAVGVMKCHTVADLSVGQLDLGASSYARIIMSDTPGTIAQPGTLIVNGMMNVGSLGGRIDLWLNGKIRAKGIREGASLAANSDIRIGGKLALGSDGLDISANLPVYLTGGTIGAYEDSYVDVKPSIVNVSDGGFSAESNITLTVKCPITSYDGEAYPIVVKGDGTVVFSQANSYGGVTTVEGGTLKIGNAGSLGSGGVTLSGGVLDVGTLRIANVVTLSGGKVVVVMTDEERATGDLVELFGYEGAVGGLSGNVEVVGEDGAAVHGYFKVLNGKACFAEGEEPEEGILNVAVGKTVTLSSQGDYTNVKGGGTLVCNGFWPNFSNLANANCWTGTVRMAGSPSEMKYYTFANLGNASSVIEIAGSVYGYLAVGGKCTSALKVTGSLYINNGNSGASYEFLGPLSGDGLIKTTGNPTTKIYFTGDTSAFAGTFNIVGGHCVLFANATSVASSAGKIVVSGKTITMPFGKTWSAVNGIEVKSGATVRCDLGEMSGEELAMRAVAGVPYAMTYFVGSVSGEGAIVASGQTLPRGYSLAVNKTGGIGVVITAPDAAKWGAISVNIRNGTKLEPTETLSGLYPVARKYWGDLQAAKDNSITISNATFKISSAGAVTAYGLENTPPDMIYKQYMDDNATTRTITITGVPYDQYRIVVYYSTDTANYNFRPLNVNDDWYAGALASQNTANPTVKGRNEVWGHSGANHNANNPAEGVNALFTDVYSGDVTLSFTRNGGTGARATPCAVQIIKVGEVYREPFIYYLQ